MHRFHYVLVRCVLLELWWWYCHHRMPSCDCITEVYDACAQDTLVNAEMLGTAPASARVSFKVAFWWHTTDIWMLEPGSKPRVDRWKVHSAFSYNECEWSNICTASCSPQNRFCRCLLCLAVWGTCKRRRHPKKPGSEKCKAPNGASAVRQILPEARITEKCKHYIS